MEQRESKRIAKELEGKPEPHGYQPTDKLDTSNPPGKL
jgi:hypothetical protein